MSGLCTREVEVRFPRDGSELKPGQLEVWLNRAPPCGTCECCVGFARWEAERLAEEEEERDVQLEAGHA